MSTESISDTNLVYITDERPPFIMVDHHIINHYLPLIGTSAFALYCYLVKCAGVRHQCYPSQTTIAEAIGISERTVRDAVKTLVEHKLIATAPRYQTGGNRTSNLITILATPGNICRPLPAESASTPLQKLPVKKNKEKEPIKYTADFSEFWNNTWKQGSKIDAFTEWKKIAPTDQGVILAQLSKWTEFYKQSDWQHHVSNWIKKRIWESEIPPFRPKPVEKKSYGTRMTPEEIASGRYD